MNRRTLLRTTAHLLLATSLLPGLITLPARADLQQNLQPMLDDDMVTLTVSLNPDSWKYVISKAMQGGKIKVRMTDADDQPADAADKQAGNGQPDKHTASVTELPPEFSKLADLLQNQLHFDPVFDGLANIGSHLTLAYRPYADSDGQLMFSLNVNSPERTAALLERLQQLMSDGGQQLMHQENFGPYAIYHLDFASAVADKAGQKSKKKSKAGEGPIPEEFDHAHLAVVGHNLIGSIGANADLLKRMMYLDRVLPPDSRFHLANNPRFAPVKDYLGKEPMWIFADMPAISERVRSFLTHDTSDAEEKQLIETIISSVTGPYGGVGMGLNIQADGVHIKGFNAPDWQNMSAAEKAELEASQAQPAHPLTGFQQHMPGEPLLLSARQNVDYHLAHPPAALNSLTQLMPWLTQEHVRDAVKRIFNVDYQDEFLPAFDGRMGFGIFTPPADDEVPDLVMYLGVKNEQAFDQMMQQHFRITFGEVGKVFAEATGIDEDEDSASASPVNENMHTLQVMVETYGVDWGGMYPPNLDTLSKEAKKSDYWKELENPVTGGQGKALDDYGAFKGQAAQAGEVFYEPIRQDGQITSYRIYGYDPGGKLFVVSNEDVGQNPVRSDLPVVQVKPSQPEPAESLKPRQIEVWQNIPIYEFPVQEQIQAMVAGEKAEKAAAQKDALETNLQTLNGMLANYGAEHEDHYPASAGELDAFIAASEEPESTFDDISNPVTEASGLGKAVADYAALGDKPGVDKAGMIFYRPVGKKSAQGYERFELYAYASDGELQKFDSETEESTVVRTDLPQVESGEAEDMAKLLSKVQPVFARKNDVWMLAMNVPALKNALSGKVRPVRLEDQIARDKMQNPSVLFFLDMLSSGRYLDRFLPAEVKQDNDFQQLAQAMSPWHSLFIASRVLGKQGTAGVMDINADLDHVDFAKLGKFFEESAGNITSAQQRAKTSSVKANMHTLQTMVETYAVDWGGCYPKDIAMLEKEAKSSSASYWKDLTNPFNQDLPALKDYSQNQAGEDDAGQALYKPGTQDQSIGCITYYEIFGNDADGQPIQDKGKDFILSNS